MITVILVEDHALVTEGIMSMLEREKDMECIGCYTTGEMLRHALKRQLPDILLMDINLPDTNGTDLCKEIGHTYPGVKIVALSINNNPGVIRRMIDHGANGYLLKDADRHEIITGIRTVMQGKTFYSKSAAVMLRKRDDSKLPPLTRREREVLELITEGLTNKQIASKLFIDVTTVDSHRKNMLAKYGVNNTSALIKMAISAHLLD
jgi:DNA-binding NarL/FixJ family response regulator